MDARLALSLVAITTAAAIPGVARACGNAVYLSKDRAAALVAKAEKDLNAGRYEQASRALERGPTPWLRRPTDPPPKPDDDLMAELDHRQFGRMRVADPALARRWAFVYVVARMRLGNTIPAEVLRELDLMSKANPRSPTIQSRLAEAQSRVPAEQDKAFAALTSLAERDLVPDAEGYVALARLRDTRGDAAGRDEALARCRKLAPKRAEVCTLEAPAPAAGKDANAKPATAPRS